MRCMTWQGRGLVRKPECASSYTRESLSPDVAGIMRHALPAARPRTPATITAPAVQMLAMPISSSPYSGELSFSPEGGWGVSSGSKTGCVVHTCQSVGPDT
jgi:hypothetical protein